MKRKSCAFRRQGTNKQPKSLKRVGHSYPHQRGGNGCGKKPSQRGGNGCRRPVAQRGGNGCRRPVAQRGGNGCRRPVSQRGSGRGHNYGSRGPASRSNPYRRFRSRRNRKRVICAGDDCPQRRR